MTGHKLNGATLPAPTLDPKTDVAQMVFAALADDGETWADLSDEDRADFLNIADHYLSAHAAWLASKGFKVVPPGSVMKPETEPEAMAMVQSAKTFLDALKRKGKLVSTGPGARGLILPKGKLQ